MTFKKVIKKVKINKLMGDTVDNHVPELERIRRFSNMENSFPEEHFDRDCYQFDSTTIIQPDMKIKRPYSKSTLGTEKDDTDVSLQRTVSFPVRKQVQK